MSYKRKLGDKKRLKKITLDYGAGWPSGADEVTSRSGKKTYLKRYWKSEGKDSCWAWNKKYARKVCRRFWKEKGYYTKKAYDLWWNVW